MHYQKSGLYLNWAPALTIGFIRSVLIIRYGSVTNSDKYVAEPCSRRSYPAVA